MQINPSSFLPKQGTLCSWNDMGQLILSQTHLALQCPPGMATQTNYFQQRINTGECWGPRAEMEVEGGISS